MRLSYRNSALAFAAAAIFPFQSKSPDGLMAAAGSRKGTVTVWDLE